MNFKCAKENGFRDFNKIMQSFTFCWYIKDNSCCVLLLYSFLLCFSFQIVEKNVFYVWVDIPLFAFASCVFFYTSYCSCRVSVFIFSVLTNMITVALGLVNSWCVCNFILPATHSDILWSVRATIKHEKWISIWE